MSTKTSADAAFASFVTRVKAGDKRNDGLLLAACLKAENVTDPALVTKAKALVATYRKNNPVVAPVVPATPPASPGTAIAKSPTTATGTAMVVATPSLVSILGEAIVVKPGEDRLIALTRTREAVATGINKANAKGSLDFLTGSVSMNLDGSAFFLTNTQGNWENEEQAMKHYMTMVRKIDSRKTNIVACFRYVKGKVTLWHMGYVKQS